MKKLLLYLCFIPFCLASTCDDDEDPTANANDGNRISAMVDGQSVSLTNDNVRGSRADLQQGDQSTPFLYVRAEGETNPHVFDLAIFDQSTGTQELIESGNSHLRYEYIEPGTGLVTAYGTTSDDPGTLNITTLTNNRVAGTFSGTLTNFNGGKVTITQGSFDVRIPD